MATTFKCDGEPRAASQGPCAGERGRKGRGIAGTRELERTDRLVPKLPGDGAEAGRLAGRR